MPVQVGWLLVDGEKEKALLQRATAHRGGPFHRAHRRCAVAAEPRIARAAVLVEGDAGASPA